MSDIRNGPLAVCHNGRVIHLVPNGVDTSDDAARATLFAAAAAEIGVNDGLEILAACPLHPTSSAVDCLDCEPLDEPNPPLSSHPDCECPGGPLRHIVDPDRSCPLHGRGDSR
jgi:hypothetical protein